MKNVIEFVKIIGVFGVIMFSLLGALLGAIVYNLPIFESVVSEQRLTIEDIDSMTVGTTTVNLNGELVDISEKTESELWFYNDKNVDYFDVEVKKNLFGKTTYDVVNTGNSKVDNMKDMFTQLAEVSKELKEKGLTD